jgi:hypothetical protein
VRQSGQARDSDPILGFVLDIGIQRMKMLTLGNGYYFRKAMRSPLSRRKVAQADFDGNGFDWITRLIDTSYQSADRGKVTNAIRCHHLLETYNYARVLYTNFICESYLSLLRIIEAVAGTTGSYEFALSCTVLAKSQ